MCEGDFEQVRNDTRVIEVYLGKQEENHTPLSPPL
ncbi:MAG: hypothetical protein ACK55G_20070 [Dolichospermum sp.]